MTMAKLDYEFAPIDVSIMTHPKACKAGPEAMGLWLWGQTYAKLHKTDGVIHRAAALVAWGGKRNIMLAKRLVEAGLWVAREDGDWVVHNFDKKSPASQSSSRDRMRELRARRAGKREETQSDVTSLPSHPVTRDANSDAECSTSTSYSSGSGSSGGAGGATPPAWWAAAIAAAEMAVGPVGEHLARWLEYDAARERKGWARNHRDAVGWLTTVVRGEKRNARASPGRGADVTKQPFDPEAPWMKIGDTGT